MGCSTRSQPAECSTQKESDAMARIARKLPKSANPNMVYANGNLAIRRDPTNLLKWQVIDRLPNEQELELIKAHGPSAFQPTVLLGDISSGAQARLDADQIEARLKAEKVTLTVG